MRFKERDQKKSPSFLSAAKSLVQDWFYHLSTGEPHTPNEQRPEVITDVNSTTPIARDRDSRVFEDDRGGHLGNYLELRGMNVMDITETRDVERYEEGSLYFD